MAATVAVTVVGLIAAAGRLVDEPLRQRLEATLNARLAGYTVRLPELDVHPLRFSLTLHGLTVRQAAHPEPPVIVIDTLDAGVHWRALLHRRLVADFALDGVRLYINRPQLLQEADDAVALEDKGWQQALEAIYPLKINQFRVTDGAFTYVDDDRQHPLEITRTTFLATNIRNVRFPDRTYPSPIHLAAVVFDRGRLRLDGRANFLAVPHAGVNAHVELSDVPLQRLKPVAAHANVHISGGTLAAMAGQIEYAPTVQAVHLQDLRIEDVAVDYVHSPQTEAAEARRIETVKEAAGELADRPTVSATIDRLTLRNASVGYVDQTRTPTYRIFLSAANLDVHDLANRPDGKAAGVSLTGYFMGTGQSQLEALFRPRRRNPELEVAMQIEKAQMRAMNDLFRAYGDFDVVGGTFSFYSELQIKNRQISGYVKPLFADIDVYDRRQDRDKALFQQLYEGLVGGVGGLLENRRDQIATEAAVRGMADAPELSTWEVVVNLVRNAFFKAILPGFDRAVRDAGTSAGDQPGSSP